MVYAWFTQVYAGYAQGNLLMRAYQHVLLATAHLRLELEQLLQLMLWPAVRARHWRGWLGLGTGGGGGG